MLQEVVRHEEAFLDQLVDQAPSDTLALGQNPRKIGEQEEPYKAPA